MTTTWLPGDERPQPNVAVVQGLVVRPGDVLIVAFANRRVISRDEADMYKNALKERLPGLADVLLLADISTLAVYRESDS